MNEAFFQHSLNTKPFFTRLRKLFLLVVAIAVVTVVYFFLHNGRQATEASSHAPPPHPVPSVLPEVEAGPLQRQAEWRLGLVSQKTQFKQGESFSRVLERLGISRRESYLITDAAKEVLDMTKVRAGADLIVYREEGKKKPVRVEYSRPGIPLLVMLRTPAGYTAAWRKFEPVVNLVYHEGTIKHSLWYTAVTKLKIRSETVMALSDLFKYDIDFVTDIQEGDTFRILYEEQFSNSKALGRGRIYAAEFVNKGVKYDMYYFENADGRGDYYTSEGKSHQKMFLQSPLQYRRISSHFSHSRLHPILKIRRPHLGVDYAAPTGTPVETVADGTVSYVGWMGGYGKIVIINHNRKYVTQYAHLSNFAKGIKKGKKVKQGDLIGYVGSTGLSTGAHLDFRLKKAGTFVDPLKELKAQSTVPITDDKKSKFLAMVKERRVQMSQMANVGR